MNTSVKTVSVPVEESPVLKAPGRKGTIRSSTDVSLCLRHQVTKVQV